MQILCSKSFYMIETSVMKELTFLEQMRILFNPVKTEEDSAHIPNFYEQLLNFFMKDL